MSNQQLLLHICCGPCSIFPLQFLQTQPEQFAITGYYYNPNIHPYKEFTRRRDTLQTFAEQKDLPLVIDERYLLEEFLQNALTAMADGNGAAKRCQMCYEIRLRQTAIYAKEHKFDFFTTTLLVSPYQQHELIRTVGEQIGKELGVPFLYYDFRSGWQEGVKISRELEMYRQPYCGCIFSEKERYYKEKKNQQK